MPSLSQILNGKSPLLLIDAGSEKIQVGLFAYACEPLWSSRSQEAGVGLFECLDELNADLDAVEAFAFCEGPGSILGIRTSAVAIRMWNVIRSRPVFGYFSLAVAAEAVAQDEVALIADARRGLWHRYSRGGTLDRVPAGELSGELLMPEGFKYWSAVPDGTRLTSYNLSELFAIPAVYEADLFHEAACPDAFLHQEPSYVKWVPQIHRAP